MVDVAVTEACSRIGPGTTDPAVARGFDRLSPIYDVLVGKQENVEPSDPKKPEDVIINLEVRKKEEKDDGSSPDEPETETMNDGAEAGDGQGEGEDDEGVRYLGWR